MWATALDNADTKYIIREYETQNILFWEAKAMTVEFVKDKETKNTYRYTATGDIAGSIYVRKDNELAKSERITVEVSTKGA